ncbi:MAG: class II aldolase/adducin family protein [Thermodesulfobacteria bacterium]|nr:class II aldolase/adducin family protein [Thermodesulfobacteriota bacterium]
MNKVRSVTTIKDNKLSDELIAFAKLLYDKGFIAGANGNMSVKLDDKRFLVTASGVHKGLMGPDGLVVVDDTGKVCAGSKEPSSEIFAHLAIYKEVPQARAVIHAHAPWCTAVSLKKEYVELSGLVEAEHLFPRVEMVPRLKPGSRELASYCGDAAKRGKVFILKGHGVVSWGCDLKEAFCLVEALENNIKIVAMSSHF